MACIRRSSRLCAQIEKLCQHSDHVVELQRRGFYQKCCHHQMTSLLHNYKKNIITQVDNKNINLKTRSMQIQQPGSQQETHVDLNNLLSDDLKGFYDDIKKELINNTNVEELKQISTYYFDGHGKAFRPMITILMSRAINCHHNNRDELLSSQRQVAMIVEMIHCASLIHDDVIDQSDTRRGKASANIVWSQKKVTMAGNFILAIASIMKARLKNDDVTLTLSKVITDLVQGELMQLGSKENETERFKHYLSKTYRKTASLIANGAKSVAMLGGADEKLADIAYNYGRNIGLAFQLIDDHLDFVSSSDKMGKPTAADLKLGLATAPVLFACEQYPELDPMIMRRFQEPGDVERAFELVNKSQGLEQTKYLAQKHCDEAIKLARSLVDSPYQKGLIDISELVVNREK
ncbi:all trans-polyprenyl-diphosphate synthase PDSS1-like [Aphidius gifuensis]|uniref:all trans-polyprenyl-diphosphate synthase PDSS1-like n=1 Tax=Aphidius gifuensis TaxID=684658 RepID=UPI001CDCA34E|nr:all trans-polyprenyl-diphosphate synthase PDSS1-like [Aphidius gifuensis]